MKKIIVSMLLSAGIAGSALGQGHVVFDTYVGVQYTPMRYAVLTSSGPDVRSIAGPAVSAELWYGFGSHLTFSQLTELPSSATPVYTLQKAAYGFVVGGVVQIPGYTSGPITFAVVAWDTN